jgi:cell division protein FtsN
MSRTKTTAIEDSKSKGKTPGKGKTSAQAGTKKADEGKPVIPQSANPKPVDPKPAVQKFLTAKAVSEKPVSQKPVAKKPVAKNKAAKVNKAKVSKAFSREIIMLFEAIEYGTDRVGTTYNTTPEPISLPISDDH